MEVSGPQHDTHPFHLALELIHMTICSFNGAWEMWSNYVSRKRRGLWILQARSHGHRLSKARHDGIEETYNRIILILLIPGDRSQGIRFLARILKSSDMMGDGSKGENWEPALQKHA